jgi:hypothetical protein
MLKFLTASALFLGLTMAAESSSESTSETSGESYTTTASVVATTTTTSGATTTVAVQKHNDLTSNYYYSDLDGSYFAFAIGQCTQKSIIGASYMKATCLDTDNLQVDLYYTSSCDTAYSSTNYTSADATFYCGGVDDYAKVTISASSCSSTTYDVYTALDVCVKASSSVSIYTSVYCSGTYGEIQYYLGSTCADAVYYSVAKMNSTCQFLFTSSSSGAKIYGLIDECYTGATTTTSGATTTASTSSIAANNYNIFSAVALLFAAVLYVVTL